MCVSSGLSRLGHMSDRHGPCATSGLQTNAEFQYILQGTDVPTLYQAAGELERALRDLKVIQDVNSNLELRNPEVQVDILRDRAAALGISPDKIKSTLYDAYGGRRITNIYTATDQYSVIMQVDHPFQADINSLNLLSVKSANNQMIPLSGIAVEVHQIYVLLQAIQI